MKGLKKLQGLHIPFFIDNGYEESNKSNYIIIEYIH